MANNIKGITVEIGGNTGPLNQALKDVNKAAGETQSELREVNKQLKFDPQNATLTRQKIDLLKNSVQELTTKQATLKDAVRQAQDQFEKGDLGADKVRAVEREYEKTTSQLKDAKTQLNDVEKTSGTVTERIKANFKSVGDGIKAAFTWDNIKSALGSIGIAAAGLLKSSLSEASEAQTVNANLAQTLKSTGGAAGMTKGALDELAESLSKNTTFEDDQVKSGEAMLLTFTNIGKDVFPQATAATLDYAQKMGVDAKSAALTLGKALNDPTTGLSKLTKSGVTFTAQQQEQIKAMQAAGDTAGAQKLMIAELNKEFGGQAAAAADTYEGRQKQLDNTFKELRETIGTAVLPIVLQITRAATDALQPIAEFISKHPQLTVAILGIVAVLGTLIGGLSMVNTVMGLVGKSLSLGSTLGTGGVMLAIMALIAITYEVITHWSQISTFFKNLWKDITGVFTNAWNGIKTTFANLWNWLKSFLAQWGPLILTVIAPVLGVPLLIIQHWGQITSFFSGMGNKISNGLKGIASAVTGAFTSAKSAAQSGVSTVGDAIQSGFRAAVNGVSSAFNGIASGIKSALSAVSSVVQTIVGVIAKPFQIIGSSMAAPLETVKSSLRSFFQGVQMTVQGFTTLLKSILLAPVLLLLDTIYGLFTGHWNKLRQDITKLGENIRGAVVTIAFGVQFAVASLITAVKYLITAFVSGIKTFIQLEITGIQIIVTTILNAIKAFVQLIFTGIEAATNLFVIGVKAIVNGLISFVQGIPGVLQAIWNAIQSALAALKSFFDSIGNGIIAAFRAVVAYFSGLPGTIGGIMNSVGSWVRSVWDGLVGFIGSIPGRFASGLSALGGAVRGAFDDAIGFIRGLPGEAMQWGEDIINGIANGIKSAAHAVGDAVNGVAQNIRSFLHFSEPDTGPLKGFHSWWKDMMYGMADDINSHLDPVRNAVRGVAATLAGNIGGQTSGMLTAPAAALTGQYASYSTSNSTNSSQTVINKFDGNYTFQNRNDIDYFMNRAALIINRKK